ncbi:MAG: leucine-rich repeat domain-containing protein [Clostridia bacterium]|nr:leucine-rich repeat domain-containing protein [Clostridia bacterium]
MKKIIPFLLLVSFSLVVLYSCSNNTDQEPERIRGEETPVTHFEYTEKKDGTIAITKNVAGDDSIVIPSKIDGKKVTEIADRAFYGHNWVVSVDIPDTVTVIGNYAFYRCIKLKTVVLPKNLEVIKDGAFVECEMLSDVTLPNTLNVLGMSAFAKTGIKTVTLEEGLDDIGVGAFLGTQLKEIVLPSSIKTVGQMAFANCPELESVTLNEGLVTIGYEAFALNPKITEIIIPKSVEQVYDNSFKNSPNLKKIKFEGNAPEGFYSEERLGLDEMNFTVYYHEGAEGFTSPEWNGYPTEIW